MRKAGFWLAVCSATWIGFAGLAPAADEGAESKCGAASSAAYADNAVSIEPGQALCLRISTVDGTLTVAPASATTPKDEVLEIDLSSEKDSTLLVVKNGTPLILKYRAQFQVPRSAEWHSTSICPVQAGIAGFEQWPHAIQAMRLSDFKVLSKDADFSCD